MSTPAFYQMASFNAMSIRNIKRDRPPFEILDQCKSAHYRREMLSYFDVVNFERVGVLEGEYLLIGDCNLLLARGGTVIRAASSWEDHFSTLTISETYWTIKFANEVDLVLSHWDEIPVVESPAIVSGILLTNYFHFSLEIFPRIRHYSPAYLEKVIVAERALSLPFQRSLLGRAPAGCTFIQAPAAIRVRNPMVSHDFLSEDGLRWLRQMGPRAQRGSRRLYIRRGSQSARRESGGELEETPEILDLLRELNFETVEFGAGKTVEAQVSMLEGAGLIIAVHGAALTNLAYLEEGVSVIEIIGSKTPRALYMHICSIINHNYFAILTDTFSESGNIILDAALLRECILNLS